jgi:undecaprenyl-diphosphatase
MTMTLWQALFLGALQGISELFPISSLAQTILLPPLLGWEMGKQDNPDFLAFVVALHLATAIALVIFFWKDWKNVLMAFAGSAQKGKLIYDDSSKLAWLLVAGSVFVGFAGLVLEKKLRKLFEEPKYFWVVAAVLVVNGVMMLFADFIKKRATKQEDPQNQQGPHTADPATDVADQRKNARDLTLIEGAAVGATQALALIPGISRSGVTIVAGLFAGLSYKEAGKFSFMLGTVAIGMAAVYKVPSLRHDPHLLSITIPAAILSGITAYLSTKFLMKYFQHNRLSPFGWFCIVYGIFALVMLRH